MTLIGSRDTENVVSEPRIALPRQENNFRILIYIAIIELLATVHNYDLKPQICVYEDSPHNN